MNRNSEFYNSDAIQLFKHQFNSGNTREKGLRDWKIFNGGSTDVMIYVGRFPFKTGKRWVKARQMITFQNFLL